jgi:hypothetical protein
MGSSGSSIFKPQRLKPDTLGTLAIWLKPYLIRSLRFSHYHDMAVSNYFPAGCKEFDLAWTVVSGFVTPDTV